MPLSVPRVVKRGVQYARDSEAQSWTALWHSLFGTPNQRHYCALASDLNYETRYQADQGAFHPTRSSIEAGFMADFHPQ